MSPIPRFWRAVEALPTLAAVSAEWQHLLGPEFPVVRSLLQPRRDPAESYPRFDGSPSYDVVRHASGEIVGVCSESGRTVTLTSNDVVVLQVHWAEVAARVAAALKLDGGRRPHSDPARSVHLGLISSAGSPLSVFLFLPRSPADVETFALDVIARRHRPFVLLTPTRSHVTEAADARIRSLGCGVLGLEHAVLVGADGQWHLTPDTVRNAIATDTLDSGDEELAGRDREVLGAMLSLGALTSDTRKSTAQIVRKAAGPHADSNTFKSTMSGLVQRTMIASRTGRGGGHWLTPLGLRRAERLRCVDEKQ